MIYRVYAIQIMYTMSIRNISTLCYIYVTFLVRATYLGYLRKHESYFTKKGPHSLFVQRADEQINRFAIPECDYRGECPDLYTMDFSDDPPFSGEVGSRP